MLFGHRFVNLRFHMGGCRELPKNKRFLRHCSYRQLLFWEKDFVLGVGNGFIGYQNIPEEEKLLLI